jgi:outer membrane protein
MKKVLFVIGMMSAITAYGQKQWTLQDCIDYALTNNITLKKSQLQHQSATEDLKGAKAALLPSLSASTNQSLYSNQRYGEYQGRQNLLQWQLLH